MYIENNISFFQLLLIDKKLQEVQPVLNQASHLIETWTGAVYQKEYLKVYFLVLQVNRYTSIINILFNKIPNNRASNRYKSKEHILQ